MGINERTQYCEVCDSPLVNRRCVRCEKTNHDKKINDDYCSHIENGNQCRNWGTMSPTLGAGNWYCEEHFFNHE